MTDLVVDTNSILDIIDNKHEIVIQRCDCIYIPNCSWSKEAPVKHFDQFHFHIVNIVRKKLEPKRKFFTVKPKIKIDTKLEKELKKRKGKKKKASKCDIDVVRLAFERKMKSGDVVIISKDKDIYNCKILHDIFKIISPDDYPEKLEN